MKAFNTIAIQGFAGCFHEAAARKYLGTRIALHQCTTFTQLATDTAEGILADAGIMAIENSIAGSILPNYELIQKFNLTIIGETYLPIKQQLLVKKGVQLAHIKEVHSHPMALQQCSDFLNQHKFKLVESDDTALSAAMVAQQKYNHIAAVASNEAAKIHELEVVVKDIHNVKSNYTRFLVLTNQNTQISHGLQEPNKMSIRFQVNNDHGSLSKTLLSIAKAKGNLTKLQSFPILGSNWQYAFYADIEFENQTVFKNIMSALKTKTTIYKTLGIYVSGLKKIK